MIDHQNNPIFSQLFSLSIVLDVISSFIHYITSEWNDNNETGVDMVTLQAIHNSFIIMVDWNKEWIIIINHLRHVFNTENNEITIDTVQTHHFLNT